MPSNLKTAHSLAAGDLKHLAELVGLLGFADLFTGDARLHGTDPIIRSPHRLGEASASAQLLIGVVGAAIWQARGGLSTDVDIDVEHALHYLHPTNFVEQAGYPNDVGADRVAVNGLFPTRDGMYVMLEAGPPYAKLLTGYLNFFDCGNNAESYAREVATWDAEDLEDALSAAGLPVCRAFTREQWLAHPQGNVLAATPPIEIVKIAEGDPVPFPDDASSPLGGVKVLDFTHVLAGPRSTRTLAEYGAEVLHVSAPAFPDTLAQHLGVDVGKYNAYLDLRRPEDLATIRTLAARADVFATTYRPTVNARFGLLPNELTGANARGIVYMSANAYGHCGPWRDRPGFDQNGQVASGFAMAEGQGGPPKFSPVFYLADLITGYFAAAGMMAALYRRAVEGGSYHVRVSLARSAMWVQELGQLDLSAHQGLPTTDVYPAETITHPSAYGTIRSLAPPLRFSNLQLPTVQRLVPYGADPALWPSENDAR